MVTYIIIACVLMILLVTFMSERESARLRKELTRINELNSEVVKAGNSIIVQYNALIALIHELYDEETIKNYLENRGKRND